MKKLFLLCGLMLGGAGVASAATISPVSYDMRNGTSGTFHYWDESYNGTGNTKQDHALLRGGTGELTDGVIATESWANEDLSVTNPDPYVGWLFAVDIVFRFDERYKFDTATFHFDDSKIGNVAAPNRVSIHGRSNDVYDDPAGTAPFAFEYAMNGVNANELTVRITASPAAKWIFLSEVTFEGELAPVPLPAGGLLLLAGLAGLGVVGRSKARGKLRG